ncbi:MAG: methylmalonyl-CoA mutase family protein [Planctomycetota bacterium]
MNRSHSREGPSHRAESLLPSFPAVDIGQWRSLVSEELSLRDFEKALARKTPDGIAIQPLYTAAEAPPPDSTSMPGEPPFVRGSRPADGEGTGWLACAHALHPDPAAANESARRDVESGAHALWLTLDRCSRLGLDATEPAAAPHVGEQGTTIYSLADLDEALAGIDLAHLPLFVDAGANGLPAAAIVFALYEKRRVPCRERQLVIGADPLGSLARDGRLPRSLETVEAEQGELAAFCKRSMPLVRSIAVSTLPYHDASATLVQELACAVATIVHYLRVLTRSGSSLEEAAATIIFRIAIGRDVFLEIAKQRALRLLWSKVLQACAASPVAPYVHAVTSRRTLTRRDPWVNTLRVTTEVFAAVVGGADVVTSAAFDEAIGQPDATGCRLARNTQTILREESHLGRVLDPAGGSYYVEALTFELARAAWALFQEIERRGGMAACLLSGWIREQIEATWRGRRADLCRRKEPVTGVSEFANVSEEKLSRPTGIDEALRARAARRAQTGREGTVTLPADAADPSARLPALIEAASRGATLATLSRALRAPLGKTPAPVIEPFPMRADGSLFEALRDAADELAARAARPRVYLANLGTIAEHRSRAMFAQNFFQAGGFEVVSDGSGNAPPEEAARLLAARLKASGASIACLCSRDERYAAAAEPVARACKAAGATRVLLAGRPAEREAAWRAAGIDGFIHIGCDVVAILSSLLESAGARLQEIGR